MSKLKPIGDYLSWKRACKALFICIKHYTITIPTTLHLCYNLPKEHYMVMALTYKNKEHIPVYPDIESLKLENYSHSPIRATA